MPYIVLNNATSTLAGSLTNVATSCTVQTGHGARFAVGTDYSFLTLENAAGTIEIVRITARSGDTLTITRGQDGTSAVAWNIGDVIECRPCKAAMSEFQTKVTASGVLKGDGAGGVSAATGTDVTTLIGANAVTNATNATNATNLTGTAQSTAINWTARQLGAVTADNDLSFDLNATNNFSCTPTAGGALTFTNITAGQSGFIKLVNGSNYAITAHANTKVTSTFLNTISATGTYIISYFSDGTNVFCATAGAMV